MVNTASMPKGVEDFSVLRKSPLQTAHQGLKANFSTGVIGHGWIG